MMWADSLAVGDDTRMRMTTIST